MRGKGGDQEVSSRQFPGDSRLVVSHQLLRKKGRPDSRLGCESLWFRVQALGTRVSRSLCCQVSMHSVQGFSFCLHCGQGLEASRSNEQLPAGVIYSSENLVLNKSRLAASSSPLQLGRCFYFGARACVVQICESRDAARFARHPDSRQLFGDRRWRPRAEPGAGRLSRKLGGGAGFGRFTRDGPVLHETGSKSS